MVTPRRLRRPEPKHNERAALIAKYMSAQTEQQGWTGVPRGIVEGEVVYGFTWSNYCRMWGVSK